MSSAAAAQGILLWSSACTPLEPGESGDLEVVICADAHAVVGTIDGLGHGREARVAALEAAALVREHAEHSVLDIIRACHAGLQKTRGVVMSVARFDSSDDSLTWAGVGNVEAVLMRIDASGARLRDVLLPRGGVVGFQLPPLRSSTLPLQAGDTLVMATDGLHSGFAEVDARGADPDELAATLLQRYEKGSDDALVVVARYLGARP